MREAVGAESSGYTVRAWCNQAKDKYHAALMEIAAY